MAANRCSVCGRFVSRASDSATPFGSSADVEPPDPEFFCDNCAVREETGARTSGFLPSHWIPARWERRAAKALGMVRAGPKLAAWGHWYRPDKVPPEYVITSEP